MPKDIDLQDAELKNVIIQLIAICAEDQVAIIGMNTTERMVDVCISNPEITIQEFSMPEYGHNISIEEIIIYLYALIRGLDTTLSLIEKLERRGIDQSVLIISAKETLQQAHKISEEKWTEIQTVLKHWLSKLRK